MERLWEIVKDLSSCLVQILFLLLLGALFIFLSIRFPEISLFVLIAAVIVFLWLLMEKRREYPTISIATIIGILAAIFAVITALVTFQSGRFVGQITFPTLTPYPTYTPIPTPTPIAALGSLVLQSEVQPDGTVKNVSSLSVNSLGVGDLLLLYPQEINIRDSAIVRLSITPSKTLISLQSVAVPTQNPTLPLPFRFTDRIDIYPVMQAELSGAGFEIMSDQQPLKAIVSDKPTEWTWTLKPKEEGSLLIVVRVSVPVRVDGIDKYLFTTLKNIPAEIKATKSLQNRIDENLPAIISALLALISGIVGFYAKSRIEQRDRKITEVERQVTVIEEETAQKTKMLQRERGEKLLSPDWRKKTPEPTETTPEIAQKEKLELLKRELARLKAIPRWQFWRR